jgi:hypothetical protein
MKKQSEEVLKEDVKWVAANQFYMDLSEIKAMIRECREHGDVSGMIDNFQELYMEVEAYVLKFMKDGEREDLGNFETIYKLKKSLKVVNTDSEAEHNKLIINEMTDILNKKRLRLNFLMAQAGLKVPLDKKSEGRPAAMSQDWK